MKIICQDYLSYSTVEKGFSSKFQGYNKNWAASKAFSIPPTPQHYVFHKFAQALTDLNEDSVKLKISNNMELLQLRQ